MMKNVEYKTKYEREDVETILQDLDLSQTERLQAREAAATELYEAINSPSAFDTVQWILSSKSLVQLYWITLGDCDIVLQDPHLKGISLPPGIEDYCISKAQSLLDDEMTLLLQES